MSSKLNVITGATGLVGGITLGYFASRRYDAAFADGNCYRLDQERVCNPTGYRQTSQAHTMGTVGTVSGIVGLSLLATGLIVYVTAPRDRVVVSPVVSTNDAGVAIAGRF